MSKEKSLTRSDSSSDISVLSNPSEASIEVIRPELSLAHEKPRPPGQSEADEKPAVRLSDQSEAKDDFLQPPPAVVVTSAMSSIHHELQVMNSVDEHMLVY